MKESSLRVQPNYQHAQNLLQVIITLMGFLLTLYMVILLKRQTKHETSPYLYPSCFVSSQSISGDNINPDFESVHVAYKNQLENYKIPYSEKHLNLKISNDSKSVAENCTITAQAFIEPGKYLEEQHVKDAYLSWTVTKIDYISRNKDVLVNIGEISCFPYMKILITVAYEDFEGNELFKEKEYEFGFNASPI